MEIISRAAFDRGHLAHVQKWQSLSHPGSELLSPSGSHLLLAELQHGPLLNDLYGLLLRDWPELAWQQNEGLRMTGLALASCVLSLT